MDSPPTTAAEQWRIDYEIDLSDIVAFNLQHAKTSKAMRNTWAILVAMMAFAVLLLFIEIFLADRLRQPRPPTRFIWPAALMGIPLYVILARKRLVTRRVNLLLREGINRNWIGRRTMILTPDEVYETWLLGKTALKWAAFEKIAVTSDHLFLYQSAITATTIPRRAFETQAAFESFVAAARRFHRAAAPGLCKGCGYDMVGIKSGKCPECGRPIPAPEFDN